MESVIRAKWSNFMSGRSVSCWSSVFTVKSFRVRPARSLRALGELEVHGINTTAPFHKRVLSDPRFASGDFDTAFADHLLKEDAAKAAA